MTGLNTWFPFRKKNDTSTTSTALVLSKPPPKDTKLESKDTGKTKIVALKEGNAYKYYASKEKVVGDVIIKSYKKIDRLDISELKNRGMSNSDASLLGPLTKRDSGSNVSNGFNGSNVPGGVVSYSFNKYNFSVGDLLGLGSLFHAVSSIHEKHYDFLSRLPRVLLCLILIWEFLLLSVIIWQVVRIVGFMGTVDRGVGDVLTFIESVGNSVKWVGKKFFG